MTLIEKAEQILRDITSETSTNVTEIFLHMTKKPYINMHGPEHHVLDGASLLVAYRNAGGSIDLAEALPKLMAEGLRMPGAMCGLWGICGAISSLGAALAIIDHTGPLSTDGTWGSHMNFTAEAAADLATTHGPRCCKRDGMIALKHAVDYVNNHYKVTLAYDAMKCDFSSRNEQCIGTKCPFWKGQELCK